MANLIYDAALTFGRMANIAAGQFPDVLNLGRPAGSEDHYPGRESTSADRMTVDLLFDSPAGGTGVAVTVQGSADGAAGWTDVGKNDFTLEEMQLGPCCTAISPNQFQYLRATVAPDGAFTGSVQAFLNTYAGK